jgi:quercetin dioxygenase-like cupin family protein
VVIGYHPDRADDVVRQSSLVLAPAIADAHGGRRGTEGERLMRKLVASSLVVLALVSAGPSTAQEPGVARANLILREIVDGMPRAEKQEVRVLTASFKPGDRTVFHTHRFPVIVYVLEGAFTLELEERAPITVKAGQAMVEPPNVKMTGYNRSPTDPLRVLIVYVSDPDTPFLDPAH